MEDHTRIENITIYWGRHKGPLIYSNTFIVDTGTTPVIVDPGGESDDLMKMSEHKAFIVNTHFHGDHRRLNYLFTRSEFFAPEPDAPMLRSNERFIDAVGITDKELREQWLHVVRTIYNITEHPVSGTFVDRDNVVDKSFGIKAIALPGHTRGHSGLYFESASLTLITDIDLTDFGPWYGNEVSDIDAFLASIDKVRHLQSKFFITSHSNKIYTRDELLPLLDRFAAHVQKRDRALTELLTARGALTMDELATYGIIYPRTSLANNPALHFFEKKMIEKHLRRMGMETGV